MFLVYFKYYFRSRATPRRVKTWVCPWRPPWSGTPVLRMAALPPSLFVLIGRAGCNQWDQLGKIGTNWDQSGPIGTSLDPSYKLDGCDVGPSSKNWSEFVGVWELDVGLKNQISNQIKVGEHHSDMRKIWKYSWEQKLLFLRTFSFPCWFPLILCGRPWASMWYFWLWLSVTLSTINEKLKVAKALRVFAIVRRRIFL